jgi:hypothetical protein
MNSQTEAKAEHEVKKPEEEIREPNQANEFKNMAENFKPKTVNKMVMLGVSENELYMSPKMAQHFMEEGDKMKGQLIQFHRGRAYELRLCQARFGGVRVCWDEVNGGKYLNDLWGNIWALPEEEASASSSSASQDKTKRTRSRSPRTPTERDA